MLKTAGNPVCCYGNSNVVKYFDQSFLQYIIDPHVAMGIPGRLVHRLVVQKGIYGQQERNILFPLRNIPNC